MKRSPISYSFYQGKAIKSHEELAQLAREKKSVYHKYWGVKPAVFIINLPYSVLIDVIKKGKLYRTEK